MRVLYAQIYVYHDYSAQMYAYECFVNENIHGHFYYYDMIIEPTKSICIDESSKLIIRIIVVHMIFTRLK